MLGAKFLFRFERMEEVYRRLDGRELFSLRYYNAYHILSSNLIFAPSNKMIFSTVQTLPCLRAEASAGGTPSDKTEIKQTSKCDETYNQFY